MTLAVQAQQYPLYTRGVSTVSYSDPAVSDLQFLSSSGTVLNSEHMDIGTPFNASFTLSNNDALNAIPAGTCQLMITLGSKFRLAAGDDLNLLTRLPMSEYFHWTMNRGQQNAQFIIIGDLYQDLPAKFKEKVVFQLVPFKMGSSNFTAQMMISNHNNDRTTLSDIAPYNNSVNKVYTNAKALGIKFIQFGAIARSCNADLNWLVSDEDNITKRFVVETSGDGVNFVANKNVMATGGSSYSTLLDNLSAKSITLRIKAEDNSGGFVYSAPVVLNNLCSSKFELSLYPNPAGREVSELTITAKQGIFNGKYSLKLTDVSGKEVKIAAATYNNQSQVKFATGTLPSGSYFLYVTNEEGVAITLPFVKQ